MIKFNILKKSGIFNPMTIVKNFTRKKYKKSDKYKDNMKSLANADSKIIKLSAKGVLSKSDKEKIQERENLLSNLKVFNLNCEQKISKQDIFEINEFKKKNIIKLEENPQALNDKFKEILAKNSINKKHINKPKLPNTINDYEKKEGNRLNRKAIIPFGNYEENFNKNLKIDQYENDDMLSKRVGLLGYKVGMMTLYDYWGVATPVTVVHVDRNQITQIVNRPYDEDYVNVQIGCGSKSLKTITKPMIGHFLKNNLPPKKDLYEFKVNKENILPVGFMLGVRHFTVGQYIDVRGTTKCKGVQGVMKRWGFKGQPASHGCSLAHRKGGSIGNCQDPGRVWKGKKMAGRMGNRLRWQRNLKIMRMDWERSLLYIKGSIPGKQDSLLLLKDCIFGAKRNEGLINYPTFNKGDNECANIVYALEDFEDPNEKWEHENMLPKQMLKEDEN